MKRLLLLVLALTLFLTACTADDISSQESSYEGSSSEESSSVSPEDEVLTKDVFESTTLNNMNLVSGSSPLSYRKTEKITQVNATSDLSGTTITYESQFFGHDSAINRDFGTYGFNFHSFMIKKCPTAVGTFSAEFTGDYYDDLVLYANGVLEIFPTIVETNCPYEYNGITVDSIYGNKTSSYSFGDPITYSLGINAELRGTGDFDGNKYFDFLFVTDEKTIVIGLSSENGIQLVEAGKLNTNPSNLHCGDVDGDGYCDLIIISGYNAISAINKDLSFQLGEIIEFPFKNQIIYVSTGDINNDRKADVILLESHDKELIFRTLFGRGDGFFGPHLDVESEGVLNNNLYAEYKSTFPYINSFSICDVTGDGIDDIISHAKNGAFRGSYININAGPEAYDYSVFGMALDDGTYRIYSGGRFMDRTQATQDSLHGERIGDGDHVLLYTSADGITWNKYIDKPMFYIGEELGLISPEHGGENWWAGNTLEPEVVFVNGTYHMIVQSTNTTENGFYGDCLGYLSSTDGVNWERNIESPVILPSKGYTYTQFKELYGYEIGFNHHELIYVADDPDGKCFHLYTGHFVNNFFSGYVRIRSSDPTCFYWDEREGVPGIAQIGNQIAYISNYDGNGNRLYLRITFTGYKDEDGERTVPTLQYSKDGLNFHMSDIRLASVDVTDPLTERNRNVYFLGFCTLNGTGEIPKTEDGKYKLVYLATTANDPGSNAAIFFAEAGLGVMEFTIG